jgi:cell division protein FtsQ
MVIAGMLALKAAWERHVMPRQVVVAGVSILTKDDIVRLMNIPPNVPAGDIDLTALQRNIMTNSYVKQAVVKRDTPGRFSVEITERIPAAVLVSNGMHYIDEDGVVLPYRPSAGTYDIPVISGLDSANDIHDGIRLINPDVLDALDIVRTATRVGGHLVQFISEIRLRKGHDIVLYAADSGVPVIFGKGDAVRKLVTLDAFVQRFMNNGIPSTIQYIDIRFEDQVVVSGTTTL